MADTNKQQSAPPPAPPAPVISDELKAAIDATVRDAVKSAFAELVEEAKASAAADPDYFDDEGAREKRTIRHALFTYALPGGGEAIAMRGDTVELSAADVARGEREGAFTDRVGEKPGPAGSRLPAYPKDEDDQAEQDAWVKAGTIPEILEAVNEDASIAPSVIEAEQRRGDDARKTLLEALATVVGRSDG